MTRLSVGVSGWGFRIFDPGRTIRQLPPMVDAGEEEDWELELVEDLERGEWRYWCSSPTQHAQNPGPSVPLSAQPRAQCCSWRSRTEKKGCVNRGAHFESNTVLFLSYLGGAVGIGAALSLLWLVGP